LEHCWRTFSILDPGEALQVDASHLGSADQSGYRLLDAMRRHGVIVTGIDPESGLLLRRTGAWAAIRDWFSA
jgi:hypothetical protein